MEDRILEGKDLFEAYDSLCRSISRTQGCYFWRGDNGNRAARDWRAQQYEIPEFSWVEAGHTYTAAFSFYQTRNRTIASGSYTKDGKKTTITAIRNSVNRLKEAHNA